MIVYLAGPMTGHPNDNYAEFDRVAKRLQEYGYTVHNPANNFNRELGLPKETYMRHALHQLLMSSAMIVLPGIEDSEGGILEVAVANALGLDIFQWNDAKDAKNVEEGRVPPPCYSPTEDAAPSVLPVNPFATRTGGDA